MSSSHMLMISWIFNSAAVGIQHGSLVNLLAVSGDSSLNRHELNADVGGRSWLPDGPEACQPLWDGRRFRRCSRNLDAGIGGRFSM